VTVCDCEQLAKCKISNSAMLISEKRTIFIVGFFGQRSTEEKQLEAYLLKQKAAVLGES
jgi:hypothetical protein